jgi:hypothetical protein
VRRDFETLVCGGLRIEEVRLEESGFGKGRSSKLTEKARYWGANFSARSDAPDGVRCSAKQSGSRLPAIWDGGRGDFW